MTFNLSAEEVIRGIDQIFIPKKPVIRTNRIYISIKYQNASERVSSLALLFLKCEIRHLRADKLLMQGKQRGQLGLLAAPRLHM